MKILFFLQNNLYKFKNRAYIIYLWIVEHNWYITKNNNFYNPYLGATVYKQGDTWNIARDDIHYKKYHSKKEAMHAAFKMQLEEKAEKI